MNQQHNSSSVALYARVSSDRQDVDLSVAGHPGVERCRRVADALIHGRVLLAHPWSFLRALAR